MKSLLITVFGILLISVGSLANIVWLVVLATIVALIGAYAQHRDSVSIPDTCHHQIHRSFPEELQRRLWITKGVRFVSMGRMEKKNLLSTLAINILSICVIGFELISILVKTKTHTMELLFPIATIIAPVLIIVLAAHENAKQYLVHAERMRHSAQRISELHSKLEFMQHTNTLTNEALGKLQMDYEAALSDSSSNHDDVDYGYFQSLHPKPFLEHNNTLMRRLNLHARGRIPYYFNLWFSFQ